MRFVIREMQKLKIQFLLIRMAAVKCRGICNFYEYEEVGNHLLFVGV